MTTIRTLLYSSAGNGKTTAALTAPGPILLINADRPNASRAARKRNPDAKVTEVQFEGRETLDKTLLAIKKDAPWATVILDTLGEAYRTMLDYVAGSSLKPTLAQYGDVQTIIDRWVRQMRDLPVNLVIVCHEEILESEDAPTIIRPLTGGRKTPEVIMGQMDVVAYVKVVADDEGSRCMAQLTEQRGRRAKDGTGELGAIREANLSEWIAAIDAAE